MRDQSQQEDSVVSQVEVGEAPDVDVGGGGGGDVVERRHGVDRSTAVVSTGARRQLTEARAAPQVIANEPHPVLRDERPHRPDEETTIIITVIIIIFTIIFIVVSNTTYKAPHAVHASNIHAYEVR